MEKSAASGILGCGSGQTSEITLNIQTTTGGNFFITVEDKHTVEQLKKIVSKKLKVSKDRICLLHRERQLRDGTLKDNGLVEGSRVILLPSVETGLLTQRPENSVMQALESLNDSQVNDFLSGKSPLNLTMRLGDHMMLIQLQLSTLNPGSSSSSVGSGTKARSTSARSRSSSTSTSASKERRTPRELSPKPPITVHSTDEKQSTDTTPLETEGQSSSRQTELNISKADDLKSFLRKQDIETLQNAFEIFKSLAEMQEGDSQAGETESDKTSPEIKTHMDMSTSVDLCCDEQSPIKSLSNLVSSPLKSSEESTTTSDDSASSYVSVTDSVGNNIINKLSEDAQTTETPLDIVMSEPTPVTTPQYVPLPSSLKNNLIESLVGGSNVKSSVESDVMCRDSVITDPIAANLTSCLCSTFNTDYPCTTNCHPPHSISKVENIDCDASNSSFLVNPTNSDQLLQDEIIPLSSNNKNVQCDKQNMDKPESSTAQNKELTKNRRLHYLLHKTSKLVNPIAQSKQKVFMQSVVNKHLKKRTQLLCNENMQTDMKTSPKPVVSSQSKDPDCEIAQLEPMDSSMSPNFTKDASVFRVPKSPSVNKVKQIQSNTSNSVSDTKALIEASKNLTQTLKKLSKEVLTNKVDLTDEDSTRAKIGQGAVIESMKHHGKGIYSGTFSGTLNPALQDRFGRPKRDISTIIHILNDLLCATPPQYRRGARITFEPTNNTTSSKNKQRENKSGTTCSEEQGQKGECGCSKCSSSSCPYGECNGHPPQPDPERHCTCRETCNCGKSSTSSERSVSRKKCMACSDKDTDEKIKRSSNKNCKKCNLASALALENSKTKCKLDQLRLVMQQKKQKREERKMKAAPYVTNSNNSNNVTTLQTENTTSVLAEEIDTVA